MRLRTLLIACSLFVLGGAAHADLHALPLKNKMHYAFMGPYKYSTFKVRLRGKHAYQAALDLVSMAKERRIEHSLTFDKAFTIGRADHVSDPEDVIFSAKGATYNFSDLHRSLGTLEAKYNWGEIHL